MLKPIDQTTLIGVKQSMNLEFFTFFERMRVISKRFTSYSGKISLNKRECYHFFSLLQKQDIYKEDWDITLYYSADADDSKDNMTIRKAFSLYLQEVESRDKPFMTMEEAATSVANWPENKKITIYYSMGWMGVGQLQPILILS